MKLFKGILFSIGLSADHNQPKRRSNTTETPFPLALLGFAQICSWGTLYYSFPQLAHELTHAFSWMKSEVYTALSICLVFSSFAAIPIGHAIDKGYGRHVMVIGALTSGVLLMAVAHINHLYQLYVIFAGIGIAQAACLYEAAFAVINNNHHAAKEAKSKIVTLTLWGGFASTVFIPLIELMFHYLGWQTTFILLGMLNLLVCSTIYAALPKGERAKTHSSDTPIPAVKHKLSWALTQPIFWALLVCFALFAAGASTFKFHLYPILQERNFSVDQVVLILAVLGPAQVVGRLLLKFIGDRLSALQLGVIATASLPITFISLAVVPDHMAYYLFFIGLFGAGAGVMTIVKGIAIPELLTKQAYGAINGAMSIPIKFVKATAPTFAALLWMWTLDYDLVLLILGLVSLLAVLCFATIRQLAKYTT